MPTYEISTPDGKTYEVDAPDEAGAQAAAAYILAGGAPTHAPDAPSGLWDVAKQIPSGAVTGLTELAMLPVTAKRGLNAAGEWAFDKLDNGVRSLIGAPPVDEEARKKQREWADQNLPGNRMDAAIFGAQDQFRAARDSILPKPQTLAGEYAKTTGEFVTPSPLGKGNVARQLIQKGIETVVPAIASETAGQMSKGTVAEPWARLAGGLAGGVGVGAYQSRLSAVPRAVAERVEGVSPEQFASAQRLMDDAAQRGVSLTAAEALSQVTNGATSLPVLQRVVEGSVEGGSRMAPFFAQRPAQTRQAAEDAFNRIAPPPADPYAVGGQAADAAERAIWTTPEGQAAQAGVESARREASEVQRLFDAEHPERLAASRAFADQQRQATVAPAAAAAGSAEEQLKAAIMRGQGATPEQAGRVIQPELAATVDSMDAARRARNASAYEEAFAQPAPQGLDWALGDPDVAAAVERAKRLASKSGAPLTDLFDASGSLTVRGWDNVLRQLDAQVNSLYRAGSPDAAATAAVRDRLKGSLAGESGPLGAAKATAREGRTAMEAAIPDPLAKAVSRSPYSGAFDASPEQVAQMIERGGASAVDAFTKVATPSARAAFAGYMSQQVLNRAVGADGSVNADALSRILRDNADTLSRLPEVRQRIDELVSAQKNAASARSGLQAAEQKGDDIVKTIMRGAEADASGTGKQVGVYGEELVKSAEEAAARAVEPWRNSPLGNVARAKGSPNATISAAEALLPRQPLDGSAPVLADAAQRIAQQDADAVAQILRQRLSNAYQQASRDLVGGEQQRAGAKFAKEIAGTPEQRAALEGVSRAVSDTVAEDVSGLLEVLRATGRRLPQGSNTSVDTAVRQDLGTMSVPSRMLNTVRTFGLMLPATINDRAQRAWLGRNTGRIADILMDPNGLETIQRLQAQSGGEPVKRSLRDMFLRAPAAVQSGENK